MARYRCRPAISCYIRRTNTTQSSDAVTVQHAAPTRCAPRERPGAVQLGGHSGRSVASINRAGRASCSEVARLAAGALEAPEGTIHGMRASQSLELPGLQAEGTQISSARWPISSPDLRTRIKKEPVERSANRSRSPCVQSSRCRVGELCVPSRNRGRFTLTATPCIGKLQWPKVRCLGHGAWC